MTISAAAPTFVQIAGNGSATVFAFPMKCFRASDVVVTFIEGGLPTVQTSGFQVTNIDVNGGGNVVFITPPSALILVDIRTNTAQTQTTEFANLGDYLPENTTECFDRLTRALQDVYRQTYQFGFHGPDNEATLWPALPSAASRANSSVMFDANGLPSIGVLSPTTITQAVITALLGADPIVRQTAREAALNITPTNYAYLPGNPRRLGAAGDGLTDDTLAIQNTINSNFVVKFNAGDFYAVTRITFPPNGPQLVDFNGCYIKGLANAANPQICIVAIQCSFTRFVNYRVWNLGNGADIPTPNPNYQCATWWYNGLSGGGSQYNVVDGMIHSQCQRALVYGALPGQTATGAIQSENIINGFITEGVSNPFYGNCVGGPLTVMGGIFYAGFEGWTASTAGVVPRFMENVSGAVFWNGGEGEFATSSAGYAAEMSGVLMNNVGIEVANPILVTGDGVSMVGGGHSNTSSITSAFVIASGVTGTMKFTGTSFIRGAGAGAFSNAEMISAQTPGSNSAFSVILEDTSSLEWRWATVGANVRLVDSSLASSLRNHRMQITAADPNVYVINTNPGDSLLDDDNFDRFGYTTSGWALNVDSGGGSTLAVTTAAGPSGYNAAQLTMVATGTAVANIANLTNLASIQTSCLRVAPGELYWTSCWINATAGGNAKLTARFYNLAGTFLSEVVIADPSALTATVWSYAEGPLAVPATAAYMAPGVTGHLSTIELTDLRIRRAN